MRFENQNKQSDAGFTLLETLIAFVILAVSLGVFLQSLVLAASQAKSSARIVAAELLATDLLARSESDEDQSFTEGFDVDTGLIWRIDRSAPGIGAEAGAFPFTIVEIDILDPELELPVASFKAMQSQWRQP
ncbi:MAG: hypothetical protein HC788_04580 [Sphingopyxis sp.]|nr:hypothetical protein [Sphingopyxis sp.]